jgi:hypothetical protein
MVTDVSQAFDQFAETLKYAPVETAAAASHRSSIEACLRAKFGMTSFFRNGSFGNGTNVAGHSDVDYFAVIPSENLKQRSGVTLEAMAAALRTRFPTTPNIRVNGPAVQLPFGVGGSEHTEVVPVDHVGTTLLGYRQFDMPDGKDGWMFSAPESHNDCVLFEDRRLGGKLRPLIRLVKAWKYFWSVPIKSFYLEMTTVSACRGEEVIVYSIDLKRVFGQLFNSGLQPIVDPRFAAQTITGIGGEYARTDALSKVKNALKWAEEACVAEGDGRKKLAFDKWDLVFNTEFPLYC